MTDAPGRLLAPGARALLPLLVSWPGQGNPALVFDRYLPLWNSGLPPKLVPLWGPLSRFSQEVERHGASPGGQGLLADVHRRQSWLLKRAPGTGECRTFRTAGRLTSGLGADHPSENGFTFDDLLGVPVLRGSALKGLCRTAAVLFEGLDESDRKRLFGSAWPPDYPLREDKARGDICFLDAYPERWPRLEVDVATVHHRAYYAGQARAEGNTASPPPLETESPVPVLFLTLAAGTSFTLRLWSRSGDPGLLRLAWECLEDGLDWLGFGAKTAVGYGRMTGHSPGAAWLDETLRAVRERHRMPDEDTALRSSTLASEWQALVDPDLKAQVRQEIERRWRERGLWEDPPRAQRKLKAIYQGG